MIQRTMKCLAVLFGSLVMVAAHADAKPDKSNSAGKGKGKGKDGGAYSQKADKQKGPGHAGKGAGKGGRDVEAVRFSRFNDHERSEIVTYFGRYHGHGDGLPPGLAKNLRRGKPLPPGWQKKLVPGYCIPEVEWLSFTPVPAAWFPGLRMQPDTCLYHYGDRVVRVYEPRREVIEVIVVAGGR